MNGFFKETLKPQFIVTLLVLVGSLIFAWSNVCTHTNDTNIHHTYDQLNDEYLPREVTNTRLDAIEGRLDRMDRKLDILIQKEGSNGR